MIIGDLYRWIPRAGSVQTDLGPHWFDLFAAKVKEVWNRLFSCGQTIETPPSRELQTMQVVAQPSEPTQAEPPSPPDVVAVEAEEQPLESYSVNTASADRSMLQRRLNVSHPDYMRSYYLPPGSLRLGMRIEDFNYVHGWQYLYPADIEDFGCSVEDFQAYLQEGHRCIVKRHEEVTENDFVVADRYFGKIILV